MAHEAVNYADQRYYASALGRFTTTDPYAGSQDPRSPATWNIYSYVSGDPVNLLDPTGEDPTSDDCPDELKNALKDKINRYIYGSRDNKGILKRISEQINGKFDPFSDEWVKHNDQIIQREKGLRDSLTKWDDNNCGDPPAPNAWKIAIRGPVQDWEYRGQGPIFLRAVYDVFRMLTMGEPSNAAVAAADAAAAALMVAGPKLIEVVTTKIIFAP